MIQQLFRRSYWIIGLGWAAVLLAVGARILSRNSILPETQQTETHRGVTLREFPNLEYVKNVPLFPGRSGAWIPALNNPSYVNPTEAAAWLKSDDPVVGLRLGSASRAYPTKILNFHEIINDTIDGKEVAVTYCPLAGSALAFYREFEGKVLSFSVADVLYESTLVMVDEPTGSLWYQLRGEAVKGPLKGRSLATQPVILCTWRDWLSAHPDSLVLSYLTGYSTNYASNYWSNPYRGNTNLHSPPGFPITYLDESRPAKELVVGVALGARTIAFPSSSLQAADARLELNGRTLVAQLSPSGQFPLAFWETAEGRSPAPSINCYWFAWKAAHWKSEVWTQPNK
ncbi:MAG: hypothetical protein HW389_2703 [Bacteroidetes bacterium]|nr:hypothetical protein [Bacteroidota bacterium]